MERPDFQTALAPLRLSLVVPCFDEQEVLPHTNARLSSLLEGLIASRKVSRDSEIVFVDDGSRDRTWDLIRDFHERDGRKHGIKLSKNCGHQTALLAGLFASTGDVVVSIDADLQDDVGAIEAMLDEHARGHDIVFGVRRSRRVDSPFKRGTARGYYSLLRFFGVDVVFDHADFRLMSRRALAALRQFGEVNLFLRGIVPLIGYSSTTVSYDRVERFAGRSKYPLRKMIALAIDGITSFSTVPLRFIALLGILVSTASAAMIGWVVWVREFTDAAVPGWASSVIPIYFLGGVQLLSVGVLGEYVAKVYMESKRRPRYFVEESI
jgi:glycosyltransferase involved in cell wall biosynthesis